MVIATFIREMQITQHLDFNCTNQNQIWNWRPRFHSSTLHLGEKQRGGLNHCHLIFKQLTFVYLTVGNIFYNPIMANYSREDGRHGDRTNVNSSGQGRVILPSNLSSSSQHLSRSAVGSGGPSNAHSDTTELNPQMASETERRITRKLYHEKIREMDDKRQVLRWVRNMLLWSFILFF